jgi:hypothetical protein
MSQVVNLTLKTTSIIPQNTVIAFNQTFTSVYGQVYNNRSANTFFNIDLKKLLGDLYEKYDRFNISLNFVAGSGTGPTDEADANNRIFHIKMSGLQFTSSYDHKTSINNNVVSMGVLQVPLTAFTTFYTNYNDVTKFTFLKQNYVNIDIKLMCIDTDDMYDSVNNSLLDHLIFSFNIEGVTEYHNDDITSHRLKIK